MGCRQRAPVAELLRVVAESSTPASCESKLAVVVRPDPRRRGAGRGAWVHHNQGCVAKAEQRRAFGRALRATGALDLTAVVRYVAEKR